MVGLLIYLSVAVEVAVGERVEVIELVHRPFSVPDERIEVAELILFSECLVAEDRGGLVRRLSRYRGIHEKELSAHGGCRNKALIVPRFRPVHIVNAEKLVVYPVRDGSRYLASGQEHQIKLIVPGVNAVQHGVPDFLPPSGCDFYSEQVFDLQVSAVYRVRDYV